MLAYLLGALLPWRTVAWVCFCGPLIPLISTLIWSPESPLWLAEKGKRNTLEKAIKFLDRRDKVTICFINELFPITRPSFCIVGHKSHGPCFHKKYMEAGVMTFLAQCTRLLVSSNRTPMLIQRRLERTEIKHFKWGSV